MIRERAISPNASVPFACGSDYACNAVTLLEFLVSPNTMALLQQLRPGLPQAAVAGLPLRSRQLLTRLERGGMLIRRTDRAGTPRLWLSRPALRWVPKLPKGPEFRLVTRQDLDRLGLRTTPPFRIRVKAAPRMGRPPGSSPGTRSVYVRRLPPPGFNPTVNLGETVLALLLLEGKSARQLVQARPTWDWSRLRERLHAEGLESRARHFGLRKLIGLKVARATSKAIRHDAVRRATTEPKPKRSRAKP